MPKVAPKIIAGLYIKADFMLFVCMTSVHNDLTSSIAWQCISFLSRKDLTRGTAIRMTSQNMSSIFSGTPEYISFCQKFKQLPLGNEEGF
nr:hypothetical protein Iba_chr01aCG13580 [Ipomoea batatas]